MKCYCGHDKDAHEHYRAGTDCSLCPCHKFMRRIPVLAWLREGPMPEKDVK